jgi:hypothetical protein
VNNNFANALYRQRGKSGSSLSYRGSSLDQKNLNTITSGSLKLSGFYKDGEGKFTKSKGHQLKKAVGDDVISLIEPFFNDWWVLGYEKTAAFYHPDSDSVIPIKTNFTLEKEFTGGRYGYRFYINSEGDKPGYLTMTLAYDTQTANFTAGRTLTGQTSGATAFIISDTDGGATGTLTLDNVRGKFQDDEIITDDSATPGSATVNGTNAGVFTSLSNAPKCKLLVIGQKELYAANIVETGSIDPTSVWISAIDTGTGIPDTWTDGTTSGDAYKVRYGQGGAVNTVLIKDKNIFVGRENSRQLYSLQYDPDGTGGLTQRAQDIVLNSDYGCFRGAISTKHGIFYGSQNGIYLMTGGQGDVFQEVNILENMSEDKRAKYDFSDADIVYLPVEDILIITARKSATTNNATLIYDIQDSVISERTGWTFKRISRSLDGQLLLSSDATTGNIYRYWNGSDDNGYEIFSEIEKEFDFGNIKEVKSLHDIVVHCSLGVLSTLTIEIDVWDANHNLTTSAHAMTLVSDGNMDIVQNGYSEIGYGEGEEEGANFQEIIGQSRVFIPSFTKIRVRIKEESMSQFKLHEISFGEVSARKTILKNNFSIIK